MVRVISIANNLLVIRPTSKEQRRNMASMISDFVSRIRPKHRDRPPVVAEESPTLANINEEYSRGETHANNYKHAV